MPKIRGVGGRIFQAAGQPEQATGIIALLAEAQAPVRSIGRAALGRRAASVLGPPR